MKFDKFGSVAFFISSVSADFFTARSLDHGQNVDLGYLEDVNGFYSVIGHDMHSNETYWEDATIWETFEQEETQSPNSAASINTGLNRRSDMCEDLTGITKFLCENVTSRYWFWGAGGALIMYYLPQAMTNWLNDVAVLIQAGRNVRRVWQGKHDGLKRRSEVNPVDYHFALPYMLDSRGRPDRRYPSKRSVSEEGIDMKITHDFVYSAADDTIYYKATKAHFSSSDTSMNSFNNGTLQSRSATSDYTIVMIITKHSAANTVAKPSCLAKMLKYHLDASSEKGRFSCRPIDNQGQWHATMHLMINHGASNFGTYGKCCD